MVKYLIAVVLALAQVACATQPSSVELANHKYGVPPTEEEVVYFMKNNVGFYDPGSATIMCNPPNKGWAVASGVSSATIGWVTKCAVNAKNRFGGYTGMQGMTVVTDRFKHQVVPVDYVGLIR